MFSEENKNTKGCQKKQQFLIKTKSAMKQCDYNDKDYSIRFDGSVTVDFTSN